MTSMNLTLLGTGTPMPSLERAGSSYLLQISDDLILFDCGPGSYRRILESRYLLTDITHIVFSHFHYDHCSDFAAIALSRWDHLGGSGAEIKVYGPSHVKKFVEKLFGTEGAFTPDQDARTMHDASLDYFRVRGGGDRRERIAPVVTELLPGDEVEGKQWTLRTVEVPHAQPYLQCLGYRVDTATQSFSYSGDSSYTETFIDLAKGSDVMIHMCHRISGTELSANALRSSAGHMEVAKIAAKAEVKKCVLTHLSKQMSVPGLPEKLVTEIRTVYDGDVVWGQDLMDISFGPVVPNALK